MAAAAQIRAEEATGERAAASGAAPSVTVTITVAGDDAHGPVVWHVALAEARMSVVVGAAPAGPGISITTDRRTAGALARGELNAQSALDTNRLILRGNLAALAAARGALEALGDLFGAVRATTTFPVEAPGG